MRPIARTLLGGATYRQTIRVDTAAIARLNSEISRKDIILRRADAYHVAEYSGANAIPLGRPSILLLGASMATSTPARIMARILVAQFSLT